MRVSDCWLPIFWAPAISEAAHWTMARAFATAGHAVTVATGGLPVPQFNSTGVNLEAITALCVPTGPISLHY